LGGILLGCLFGTDGVRGVANQSLTPEMALGLGQAAGAYFLKQHGGRPQIIIGKDTRISGDMLEAALAAGLASVGVDVLRLGVIPTPGVAFLCRHLKAAAGVMISASHNPVPDNGIKFFDHQGYKLSDTVEDEIEAIYFNKLAQLERPIGVQVGVITDNLGAIKAYEDYLVASVPVSFVGLKIVIDCGFGAAYDLAPRVLERLGATVIPLHNQNDGSRINVRCGSTHTGLLQEKVKENGAHLGVAHDGDADRVIAVDERGVEIDGDQIITICGLQLLAEGKLKNKKVAVTVYSNLGLIEAFKQHQAEVVITANGDRYVLEALREQDLVLGGEQSGHIIFLDKNTTGDGVMTALQLIAVVVRTGRCLSELAAQMKHFPQVLENVRVKRKEGWEDNSQIKQLIAKAEQTLVGRGRILVRASGTEPLIRVMAEGPDAAELERITKELVELIQKEQGG